MIRLWHYKFHRYLVIYATEKGIFSIEIRVGSEAGSEVIRQAIENHVAEKYPHSSTPSILSTNLLGKEGLVPF